MTLNLTIITTKKEEQMKVSCSINGQQNNIEELKILTEELHDSMPTSYKKRTLNQNNKQFLVDMKSSPKQFTQNEQRHQGAKTRIEDEILRGCRKQNKKPDQETD
jgi:hypothetical protein